MYAFWVPSSSLQEVFWFCNLTNIPENSEVFLKVIHSCGILKMGASSDHLTLAPSASINMYFRRSWTSPEVFSLLEGDCNNYFICRALPAWGKISTGTLDKQAPCPAVLHTHTNPASCLPDGLKPCLCKGRNPCHTIPNSWMLLSDSCPGRGSTSHSCLRRTHWCELSLDPLQSVGTDKQTNRTIHSHCTGYNVPLFADSLRFQ